MTTYYGSGNAEFVNIPVVRQLRAIFEVLPDKELLASLKAPTGRPGYTVEVLWKTYVGMTILNLSSFADLIRALQNNPYIAIACGITSQDGIPSKFAYSRFMRKLSEPRHVVMVKNIMRSLARSLYAALPDFGKSVAIDSTDLRAWSNGSKKPVSDPDATWAVKPDTAGRLKFFYGYKLHLLADTKYELPIVANITTASLQDVRAATRVLSHARYAYSRFGPDYVIADAGYCSKKLRYFISSQFNARPVIKRNPRGRSTPLPKDDEQFRTIYARRTSIERLFGRLKQFRRLNKTTVRRIRKVSVHCFLSLIVVQAQALHFSLSNEAFSIRQCVHAIS